MSRTSSSGTQRQFTLTRRDDLSEYQKAMFDLMQSWGTLRLSLLTCLFKTVFSEEEITDKEACSLKLYALAKGNIDNPKPATRTTTPAQAPAPAVKPEPVASIPTIKEETPAEEDEGPTDIFAILDAQEPEEANNPLAAYVAEAAERNRKDGD